MSRDEAIIITKIALSADGFCGSCQRDLVDLLRKALPDHVEAIDSVWKRREEIEAAVREKRSEWFDSGEGDMPTVLDVQ